MAELKISLAPKTGAFTALRAYVDGDIKINTMGGDGSWTGPAGQLVRIEAVGVRDSTFDCKVKGGAFDHEKTHTLNAKGRYRENLKNDKT